MQENNFEKQVKDKMEELKIPPSGELWQKVSGRIGRKKRDDRYLIAAVFLIVVLILGGVTWWGISPNNDPAPAATAKKNLPAKQIAVDSTNNHSLVNTGAGQEVIATTNQAGSVSISQEKTATRNARGSVNTPAGNPVATTLPGRFSQPILEKEEETTANLRKIKELRGRSRAKTVVSVSPAETGETNDPLSLITPLQKTNDLTPDEIIAEESNPGDFNLLTERQKLISAQEPITAIQVKPTGTPVVAPHPLVGKSTAKKRQAWNLGINLSAGIATTRSGYLGIVSTSNDENKEYVQMPTGSTGNASTPNNSVIYKQSPVRLNTGFTGGIFLQRHTGAKTAVVIGLNYKYYSTRMTIGNRIDSAGTNLGGNALYRAGIQNDYINRYHFMELPLGLQFRVTRQQQRPVYLYAGVTIARLLGSNALQFHNVSNSYYKDNSVLTKTQFDASMKMLFAFSRRNPNGILAGPQLNFGLGKIATEGTYKNRNYSYLGITIQKNFY